MKLNIITGLLISVLLVGCGGGGSYGEHAYIATPNGLTFTLIGDDVSYQDSLYSGETHLYAIEVRPGYLYSVYLDTLAGDSDLYLYYDYSLSSLSLLGYSELSGFDSDSVSFYTDFHGTVYIEVFGVTSSDYFVSVEQV